MQQTTPDSGVVYSVLDAISDYGWHAVILVGVLYFAWNKYVKPSLSSVTSSSSSSPAINGDDSRAPSLEEMRRARAARLQSEYDRKAAEEAEVRARKEKEAEEKKRLQKIEEWNNLQEGKSYYAKTRVADEPEAAAPLLPGLRSSASRTLRSNDYNPLTGSGGSSFGPSCGFRPGRRGPASGG